MNNIHDISEVDSLSSLSITKHLKLPPDTLNTVVMPSALWGPFITSQVQLTVLELNAKFTAQWIPGCTLNLSAPVGGLNVSRFLYVLTYSFLFIVFMCIIYYFYKVVWRWTRQEAHVEVGGQLFGVISHLPPSCGVQGVNSGDQASSASTFIHEAIPPASAPRSYMNQWVNSIRIQEKNLQCFHVDWYYIGHYSNYLIPNGKRCSKLWGYGTSSVHLKSNPGDTHLMETRKDQNYSPLISILVRSHGSVRSR